VNNPDQNNLTAPPTTPPRVPKQRHGCLLALLIVIIVINSVSIMGAAILTILGTGFLGLDITIPLWNFILAIVMGVLAIICTVALFMWKKWGFWGLIAIVVINLAANVATGDVLLIVSSIFSAAIDVGLLYGTLQIGGRDKGWPQLE